MDMVTYLECCASCCFENSLHLFLEETRCSSRSVHRSFHLPHVSRFFSTTRRIHSNQLVLWHFPTSSHRDWNTFKQLMSNHCIVLNLSSNLHQVRRQPFTCLVVIDRSVVYFVSGNVTHRNLVDKITREHTGRPATVRCRLLSGSSCSIVSSPPVTSGLIGAAVACARLLTAGSMSSDSITSVSTPPVCASIVVEMRFDAAGSGGAVCSSWALASTRPSSPAHKRSNLVQHRFVLLTLSEACCAVFGWTVSLHQSSCDVPSSRHHYSGARISVRSCDLFQRSFIPALTFAFPSN